VCVGYYYKLVRYYYTLWVTTPVGNYYRPVGSLEQLGLDVV